MVGGTFVRFHIDFVVLVLGFTDSAVLGPLPFWLKDLKRTALAPFFSSPWRSGDQVQGVAANAAPRRPHSCVRRRQPKSGVWMASAHGVAVGIAARAADFSSGSSAKHQRRQNGANFSAAIGADRFANFSAAKCRRSQRRQQRQLQRRQRTANFSAA